jgi:hypothetical protein
MRGVLRSTLAAALAAVLFACAGGEGREPAAGPRVPSSPAELAVAAYVFAYPLVLFDRERLAQVEALGAHNQLVARTTTSTPFTADRVTPDADTVSAVAYLDLRTGPLVLSVPASGKRFTRIELLDAYTNVFASLGSRTQGNEAASFVIVGPDSSRGAVSGATVVEAPTNFVRLHGQVAAQGERDVPAVSGLMRQWALTPLAEFQRGKRRPAMERPRGIPESERPVKRVESLEPGKYFEEAARLMKDNPPSAADGPLAKRFPTIGLDWKTGRFAAGKMKDASRARNDGLLAIRNAPPSARAENGWTQSPPGGSWGVEYVQRAAAARAGLGGALAEDVIEFTTSVDASGRPLQGGHRYALSFAKPPPVAAFWSLTLLDGEGRMVDNVRNRYALRGDRLRKGDATVHVQHAPPDGEAKQANWLPAPSGPFQLVLRLYAPKDDAVSGAWKPPAVKRVD